MDNEKDNLDNIIKFTDSVSKALEGLKDKYDFIIFECESKNEKPDNILNNWVNQANLVIKEKFEEIFMKKYLEENFQIILKTWIAKYKDNTDFILNAKVFLKNLHFIRNTIKAKVTASDSLSYMNLTDTLINKSKSIK